MGENFCWNNVSGTHSLFICNDKGTRLCWECEVSLSVQGDLN